MRVGRRRPAWTGEDGAAGVVVALLIVALVGFAALAVDLGNAWATRRNVTVATDAAALAAAAEYARGNSGCAVAPDYVASNHAAATMTACSPGGGAGSGGPSGWVEVSATAPATFVFAGVLGVSDPEISSSTTAEYSPPTTVYGNLRPFGLCLDAAELAWIPASPPSGVTRIPYGSDQEAPCGYDAGGNWGLLDLNGGSNSNSEFQGWVRNGYDGAVNLGDVVEGDPGALSPSITPGLAYLVTSQEIVGIPVFDQVAAGDGANADFRIAYFVGVRFVAYQLSGPADARWIEVEFKELTVEGSWTGSGGPDTGVRTVRICDTDDPLTGVCGGSA